MSDALAPLQLSKPSGRNRVAALLPSPGVAVLLVLLLSVLGPVVFFLLRSSLSEATPDGSVGAFTGEYYRDIVSGQAFGTAVLNTVVYAAGAALVAMVVGSVQAWIAERTNSPFRSALYLAAFVSLGIPYTLNTVAYLLLLGRNGLVNQVLVGVFGFMAPPVDPYNMWGMILIEGLTWVPMAFLMCASTLRNLDPSLEEAVLMSGGGLGMTIRRVTLPLMRPTFLALALLVFTRGLESFEVPALVGSPARIQVLTTLIYDQVYHQMPPLYGRAAAFSACLVAVVSLLLYLYLRTLRDADRFRVVSGKAFRPRIVDLGRWRFLAAGLLLINLVACLGLPLFVLAWTSLLRFNQPVRWSALRMLTTVNYRQVLGTPDLNAALLNTVAMGVGTGLAATALGAAIAWLVVRRRRGAALLDQVTSVPLSFPALVLGLGFLEFFLAVPLPIYGTLASLVIASTVAVLPYATRYAFSGVLQLHKELEEAAVVSGAGGARLFLRIVLPLVAPSLAAALLFSFLLSARATGMMLLISGPDTPIVAVQIFDMWSNGAAGQLAAVGLVWTGIATVISTSFFVLSRRFGIRVG